MVHVKQLGLLLACTGSAMIRMSGGEMVPPLAAPVAGTVAGRVSRQRASSLPPGSSTSITSTERISPSFESEGWEGKAEVSDWEPFRLLGRSMVDYIVDYYQRIEEFPVRPKVEPGYLKKRLTARDFPSNGEKWSDIMNDVESHIMPGITHWQSPRFFGFYPAQSSPPAVLGDMLASMFNVIGFSWEASPAATELETIVLDQLGRAIGLPDTFLTEGGQGGGGVLQGTASEGTLVALLAARTRALKHMRRESPAEMTDGELLGKMTLYTSDQAHSSVQKAANIAGLGSNMRLIPVKVWVGEEENGDNDQGQSEDRAQQDRKAYAIDAAELSEAMKKDCEAGLTPMFVCANVGSTSTCAIDHVGELGNACRSITQGEGKEETGTGKFKPWLHVDAAYAGSAAVCPENRWILDGVETADSFMFNAHKWLLTNFQCAALWVKQSAYLIDALSITPEYLKSKEYLANQVSDYRDWQIPLSRPFRSLKLWLTMRSFGLEKIKGLIRHHTKLTKDFEAMVRKDDRFEIVAPVRFGLVCIRLKGTDAANDELKSRINTLGLAFFSSTILGGRKCLRISVGGPATKAKHMQELWDGLRSTAEDVIGQGI